MKTYVAYYRVSKQKQGTGVLDLAAQEAMVKSRVEFSICIIDSFVEVESGRKDRRPELEKAIAFAKERGAALVIAKLGSLSRNADFIFALRDSGVDFECADMPQANTLTIGIFAAMVLHEREVISQRTKAALAAKKEREPEWKAGTPQNLTPEARRAGLLVRQQNALTNENNVKAAALAQAWRKEGKTLIAIADMLDKEGFKTPRGNKIVPASVQRLLDKNFD